MDLVACNWGRNTKYQRYLAQPLRIHYGDYNGGGRVELIEACRDVALKKEVPWRHWDSLMQTMPFVEERIGSFAAYSEASVTDILGTRMGNGKQLTASTLDSMVFLNRGDHFEAQPLPRDAQLSPAFGVCVADWDGDGAEDVFLAQNFFGVDAETSRYDAGRGLCLKNDGHGGFAAIPGSQSGVTVYGEQRGSAVADYDGDGRVDLVVTQNGAETKLFHNEAGKPGLRVRLKGPPGNISGIGAQVRLNFTGKMGPCRELHAGAGYWSQDSSVPVLATPGPPTKVSVSWPGGKKTETELREDVREVTIDVSGKLIRFR
jgi:hypothetical protein